MYKIAIVEDEIAARDKLVGYIGRFGTENDVQFDVASFGSALPFLSDYKSVYDIVFMDIELPTVNGMEAARRLREIDKSVTLIFVTNMAQYAVSGYEVDALSFIVKPVSYTNFALKLNRAIGRIRSEHTPFVVIKGKNNIKRIRAEDIRYVEVANHSLVWHTDDGVEQSTGSLKSVAEQLGSSFALCNQCYLVNLRFCTEVSGYTVKVGGDLLQISRPKRSAFIKALNLYLNGSFAD